MSGAERPLKSLISIMKLVVIYIDMKMCFHVLLNDVKACICVFHLLADKVFFLISFQRILEQ
jgi:hypothetical protein